MNEEENNTTRKRKVNGIINAILISIIVILLIALIVNEFVLTPMKVVGPSMVPTLHDKQVVFVLRTKDVTRGDIVVFKRGDKAIVKRVIGVAGDNIVITNDGKVLRNGKELKEKYINKGEAIKEPTNWNVRLKEGELFVLGDNRNNSFDSEDYGPIKRDTLIGKLVI